MSFNNTITIREKIGDQWFDLEVYAERPYPATFDEPAFDGYIELIGVEDTAGNTVPEAADLIDLHEGGEEAFLAAIQKKLEKGAYQC